MTAKKNSAPLPPARRQLSLLLATLAILGALYALQVSRHSGEAPLGLEAPEDEFSEARARALLASLLGEQRPHPTGSAEGARVRAGIVAELGRLGYEPEVRASLVFYPPTRFATVRNVVARLRGREPGRPVLLACHYDSVRAGPGASDDGSGVAAMLEIARALALGPQLRNDVLLLFDEGEEDGLLGARAFAEYHPAAEKVLAVVNLEARGSSGASLLFETGADNAWLAELFAEHLRRPTGNSLAHSIYERLPNDTDLTVFKRKGLTGVNFAYIGDVAHYHTPLDDLEHLSSRSLQHHGDNALAMVRAIAEVDPATIEPGNAVFFDLLGLVAFTWRTGWTLVWCASGCLLLALAIALLFQRGLLDRERYLWGLGAPPLALVALLVVGALVAAFLGEAGGGLTPWPASPAAPWTAHVSAALAAVLATAFALQGRAGTWGLWAGIWSWCAAIAIATALLAPDVYYPAVLATLAAGAAGLAALLFGGPVARHPGAWAALVPVIVLALVWLPLIHGIWQAAGLVIYATACLPVGSLLASAAPLLVPGQGRGRWLALVLSLSVCIIAVLVAHNQPVFTPESPQGLSLIFLQDEDEAAAHWLLRDDALPTPALVTAGPFGHESQELLEGTWAGDGYLTAPADTIDAPPPRCELRTSEEIPGGRRLTLNLASSRGAIVTSITFLPGVTLSAARIDGAPAPEGFDLPRADGPRVTWVSLTTPPEGVELILDLEGTGPLELEIRDSTSGLPAHGEHLLDARGSSAVPRGRGDATVLSRRVTL